jgi:cell division protein FtsB
MTGSEASADTAPRRPAPRRFGLSASRGGAAWMLVVLLIGAFLAIQFGRQIYASWEIGQQAAAIEAQIATIEEENAELARELAYLRSDAYIAAEARRLANLGSEGERLLIIPPGAEEPLPEELTAVEIPKPMLQQWLDLFFGAPTPSDS